MEDCHKLKAELPERTTLYKFATMDKDERKEIMKKIFNNQNKIDETEKCIEALPVINVKMTAEVKGADEINVGDLLTVKIRVEFPKLKKGEESGYVHSM